jgi:SAM-dependent methyltransferase
MFEAEDHHWWYVGNHENFLNILQRKNIIKNGITVLDAGCGTGKWLEILKKSYKINETGIDYNETALEYSRTRGKINFRLGDINKCIFNESSFDLITSFDVICNSNIDETIAIKNFQSYLRNDEYLLLTVPAFQFLLSKHDEVVHQNKRYRKKQIKLLLENNGFEIIKISYSVCLLFPLALIKRILNKLFASKVEEHNEVKMPPKIINQLFLLVMRAENFLLRYISLPFGLSVFVLAKKKPANK